MELGRWTLDVGCGTADVGPSPGSCYLIVVKDVMGVMTKRTEVSGGIL